MTSTLLRASLPATTTTTLIDHAHRHGIRVWWRHLQGRDGQWSCVHQWIWLRPDRTDAETRSILAHELEHAALGHAGPQPAWAEARAWRHAARLLITDDFYAAAETEHGPHPGALAVALDVTQDLITAYQALLRVRPAA